MEYQSRKIFERQSVFKFNEKRQVKDSRVLPSPVMINRDCNKLGEANVLKAKDNLSKAGREEYMAHRDGENKIEHQFLVRNNAMPSQSSEAANPALHI